MEEGGRPIFDRVISHVNVSIPHKMHELHNPKGSGDVLVTRLNGYRGRPVSSVRISEWSEMIKPKDQN